MSGEIDPTVTEAGLDAVIGVDVGGTHTDVCAIVAGRRERGKALTDYSDFGAGVLAAIEVAAAAHDLTLDALLGRTRLLVNGTTVVTNAITTLTGSTVGVLVTAGFRDTFRLAGGPRIAAFDDHLQVNAPDITPREALVEVDERIDWAGEELAPVNLDQVGDAARYLVEEVGVDSIAICFVNSFLDGSHEKAAAAAISVRYPDLFISLSHEVFPVRGENRRWTTALLNSFVQEGARNYLDSLSERLRSAGLAGATAFFQGLGGGISLERAKRTPLALLGSGPAGGAIGANSLARRMGLKRVLLGDMGGTSFDTGIVVDNEIHIDKNLQIGLLQTGVNLVDVVSVGAGGGSIAWVGERGVPQVGPQSAGSEPGPAAYGKGGSEPTVTDAMVAIGLIDPDRYLGGRMQLRPQLAAGSLAELESRFGWSTEEAGTAIHDLVVANMSAAVREVSVGKGYDPRDFVFFAYGGTLPLFAMQIAGSLGIRQVVIPENSSVFCALGLLAADFVVRDDRTVAWDLSSADRAAEVNRLAAEMTAEARRELRDEGFADDAIEIRLTGDFRFLGQSYELTMPLLDRELSGADAPALAGEFFALYESTYGEGTAWRGVPTQLLNVTVTAVGRQLHGPPPTGALEPVDAGEIEVGRRSVFLPDRRERIEIPVYGDARFTAGSQVDGPAIVDASDTTIYVPAGSVARRDEWMNFVLSGKGE
jgi:N-methylhydantoinase A